MDTSIPRLALAGLAVVILLTLLVTGATSTASFATHNPSWDGTAELRDIADDASSLEVVRNVSAYNRTPANGSLAIVLSPSEPYGTDAAAIRGFLDRGGTVLIAEDFRTNANPLLSSIGASARFDGRPVRDERYYERSPTLAEVTVVDETTLTRDVQSLVLNRGTVLEANNATVLARTTSAGYLDLDGDETLDAAETPAERPVLAVESVGDGRVLTLADPSVFINSMLEYGDNRAFATTLLSRYDRVLVDVSHAASVPPLVALLLTVRESLPLQVTIGGILVVAIAGRHRLGTLVKRILRDRSTQSNRPPLDAEDVTAGVSRRHPDWDEERIERVTERAVERLSDASPTGASENAGDRDGGPAESGGRKNGPGSADTSATDEGGRAESSR